MQPKNGVYAIINHGNWTSKNANLANDSMYWILEEGELTCK